jgi:hypothetical protein
VRYKTIEAGRSHRQQSFLSHPWTACTIAPPIVRLVMNGQPVRFVARCSAGLGALACVRRACGHARAQGALAHARVDAMLTRLPTFSTLCFPFFFLPPFF